MALVIQFRALTLLVLQIRRETFFSSSDISARDCLLLCNGCIIYLDCFASNILEILGSFLVPSCFVLRLQN